MALFYRYYNLVIKSGALLSLKEQPSLSQPIDICLSIDENLGAGRCETTRYEHTSTEMLINSPRFSAVVSGDGKEITVSWIKDLSSEALTDLLSFEVFPLALFLQGTLQIHASAVCRFGRAICFLGDREAGKSTMAASFVNLGYSLLEDDMVLLRKDGATTQAFGNCQRARMRGHTHEVVDLTAWTSCAEREHGKLVFSPPARREASLAIISDLVVLQPAPRGEFHKISPAARLGLLLRNIPLSREYMRYYGDRFMVMLGGMFDSVQGWTFGRSENKESTVDSGTFAQLLDKFASIAN